MNFGVLSDNIKYPFIESILLPVGEIVYKKVGYDIDAVSFLKETQNVKLNVLVVDSSGVEKSAEASFIKALTDYRINQERTRIILIDFKRKVGDPFFSEIVNLGIYDIIQIDDDVELLPHHLKMTLDEPKTLSHGLRFKITGTPILDRNLNGQNVPASSEKIIVKNRLVGKVVIGLAGVARRVGTTHLSISLANFLQRKGFRVAVLELNQSGHIGMFANSYDDVKKNVHSYTLKNVDYYTLDQFSSFDINIPFRMDYNFYVLDIGVYADDNPFLSEFERSQVKSIVTTAREWDVSFLGDFVSRNDSERYDYLVNFSDQALFDYISHNMNAGNLSYNLYKVPFECNVYDGSGFDELFPSWLNQFGLEPETVVNVNKGSLKNLFTKKK